MLAITVVQLARRFLGAYESNMFPANATIAAVAVFQLGLLILVTPAAPSTATTG